MFVVGVTPLKKGIQIDTLSYFSSKKYPHGTVLEVPVRNNTVLGMVTHVEEVSATKAALRAATFSLKKLPVQKQVRSLSSAYIKTAEELSAIYACTVSSVLFSMLPPELRKGEIPLPHIRHAEPKEIPEPEVLQGTAEERYRAYRSLVRETFAHAGSVHVVVPTSIEADELYTVLSVGIEERTVLLTSTLTKSKIKAAFEEIEDYSRPKLIITTISYAVLERHDITDVIVEHARSNHFNERTRPHLDYRTVLRVHARHSGRRIIFGDLLPRTEEESERRLGHFGTYGETPKRLALPGKLEIVRMKNEPNASNVFSLFSPKVIKAIEETRKAKGKVFLFAARRGLAPVVACIDCGFIFRSPNTGAPYSLVRTHTKDGKEERWFVCGSSGVRERAADTCPNCASWRLRERGIGIQSVHDELVKALKGVPIILFDYTTAATYKKAAFLQDKFYKTKGAVMLGTQMALPYLTEPIDTSIVVNMDALFATPTWRLQEDNLSLLLRLREETTQKVYVQTRTEEDQLLTHAKRGTVESFYDEEIELRKTFNYPPFTTFIHLTWQGNDSFVLRTTEYLKKALAEFEPKFYLAPPSVKGTSIQYCLVRVATKDWPLEKLTTILRSLPPSIRIMINPDRIV